MMQEKMSTWQYVLAEFMWPNLSMMLKQIGIGRFKVLILSRETTPSAPIIRVHEYRSLYISKFEISFT